MIELDEIPQSRIESEDVEAIRRLPQDEVACVNLNEMTAPLINPHKGWVIHYYDNTIEKYGNRLGSDNLDDFPGFTTVYLRLAWNYLEPEEGCFNWEVIEEPIRRWRAAGKRIAFRVSCCESDPKQPYATPEWIRRAGAKGAFFGPDKKNWEPDYADPVFLEKLERFLSVFAERYDGKDWVEFIDMGSVGVWGEWHAGSQSGIPLAPEMMRRHIDIHARFFRRSKLFQLYGPGEEIYSYARRTADAGLRCDSAGVAPYYYAHLGGYSHRTLFEKTYPKQPVVVEPAHYSHQQEHNTWQKGSTLAHAVEALHPTWVTVHHWPQEWLNENRETAERLANRMGYWFLAKTVMHRRIQPRGAELLVRLNVENRGVAPAYHRYVPAFSLVSIESGTEMMRGLARRIDVRRWKPGHVSMNNLRFAIPFDVPAGRYILRIGLLESARQSAGAVQLGNHDRDSDGFYRVSEIILQ